MNRRNYQKEMDEVIETCTKEGRVPRLLLHACCAPCSSYCLEYLSEHFRITVFYYNPNITDREEYAKRLEELKRLILRQPHRYAVNLAEGRFEPERFFRAARGLENCAEGGERCARCFALRLTEAARFAACPEGEAAEGWAGPYDYMATTLTISPLKNAALLNEIGASAAASCGISYLPSDFKKRGGYQRSIELSREYGLYRQDYCGCVYSKRERDLRFT